MREINGSHGTHYANSFLRTEQEIALVHAAAFEDVDEAVKAARKALKHPSWKKLSPTDRVILLGKLADLIENKQEVLATVDAWDNGE